MPQFEVRAPFAGYVRVKIEAEDEASAIEKVLGDEFVLAECIDEWRVVRNLGKGYATVTPINDSAEEER
jgi:hypothetical protein